MSVPSFTRIERGLGGTHDLKITKVHFFHSNTSEYNCLQNVLISMYSSILYMSVPGFIRIVRGSN